MPTTTNFGWTTPADTDYVKDGANAIRTLANGIDTSLVDLKGGTTGQILSKNSNTDLDYTWINNDQGDITAVNAGTGISVTGGTGPTPTVAIDSTVATLTGSQTLTNKTIALGSNTVSGTTAQFNTALTDGDFATLAGTETLTNKTISASSNTLTGVINNTLTTTTGDIIYASSANTPARLGIGTTGQILTVSGGVPVWAAAAGGGKVLQVVSATYSTATTIASTTMTDTGLSASITPSATGSKILVICAQSFWGEADANTAGGSLRLLRGATEIWTQAGTNGWGTLRAGIGGASSVGYAMSASVVYLDSPSTTSSTTYKTQGKTYSTASNGKVIAQHDGATSTIVLLEIGA